jgi:hypothetical protein
MTIDGANGSFYSPTADFPYLYRVTVTFTSALGINQALSNEVMYTPQSGGSGPR